MAGFNFTHQSVKNNFDNILDKSYEDKLIRLTENVRSSLNNSSTPNLINVIGDYLINNEIEKQLNIIEEGRSQHINSLKERYRIELKELKIRLDLDLKLLRGLAKERLAVIRVSSAQKTDQVCNELEMRRKKHQLFKCGLENIKKAIDYKKQLVDNCNEQTNEYYASVYNSYRIELKYYNDIVKHNIERN